MIINRKENNGCNDTDYIGGEDDCYSNCVKYLAIGNSISVHGKCSYWPEQRGMASTYKEKDYYHLICRKLETLYKKVDANVFNFYQWEVQSNDREESYVLIDSYLKAQPDIITVQLGENIPDYENVIYDYEQLLKHLKTMCPDSIIIVIDAFWRKVDSDCRRAAAEKENVEFVSLSDIGGMEEYECGLGTRVIDERGGDYTVTHPGVAKHPNDKAMQIIADRVWNVIMKELKTRSSI